MTKSGKREPNLWREAYKALYTDEEEKDHMQKLQAKLRQRLNNPTLNLKTEDGYKKLLKFISKEGAMLEAKKRPERFHKVLQNILEIKGLVEAGAAVGGPYVAIPAAALFLVFSMDEIYLSEKDAMFQLTETASDYYVLTAKSHDRVKVRPEDDEDMKRLRHKLRIVYVGLYKAILFASAQLANFLCDDFAPKKWFKNVMKAYNWEEQLNGMNQRYEICQKCCEEMAWQMTPGMAVAKDTKPSMGPGPRNALHWAAVDKLHSRVEELISSKECPINALTPRSWTASHLAAEHGDVAIMKTLRSAPGVDFYIKNEDGCTPLHVAALNNRAGAVSVLLGWDRKLLYALDNRNWSALLLASSKGHVKVLEALKVMGQDVNEGTTRNGWSALHVAAENGHVDAVKFLLASGAKKNALTMSGDWKGLTAKQIAQRKGKLDVVGIL